MSARSLSRAKSRISDGVGGGRFDLLGELVPDLEGPRTLGNVDDEKEFGDQQCFEGGDPEVLQPFADANATVKSLGSPEITIKRPRSASTMHGGTALLRLDHRAVRACPRRLGRESVRLQVALDLVLKLAEISVLALEVLLEPDGQTLSRAGYARTASDCSRAGANGTGPQQAAGRYLQTPHVGRSDCSDGRRSTWLGHKAKGGLPWVWWRLPRFDVRGTGWSRLGSVCTIWGVAVKPGNAVIADSQSGSGRSCQTAPVLSLWRSQR